MTKGLFITDIEFTEEKYCFKKGESFTFKPGLNLLVGDQGCGKSTILKCFTEYPKSPIEVYTERAADFFFFDTEKHNPRMVADLNNTHLDARSVLTSKFQSHGETLLPCVLALRQGSEQIIFLDEPESGLSIRSQLKVVEAIQEALKKGSQLVIATHSYFIMEMADEVLSLEHRKWMKTSEFIESQRVISDKTKKKTTKRKKVE